MNKEIVGVKSADRALDVLERLVSAPNGLSHTALFSDLGIPKSSLSKLLRSLMVNGFVERDEEGRFRTGEHWRRLVKASLRSGSLDSLVVPALERIVRVTGETAGFNLVSVNEVETVSTVNSPHPLLYTMKTGDRAPLYAMSAGLAILAHLPEDVQRKYSEKVTFVPASAPPFASGAALRRRLAEVRKQGYAQVQGFREGIIGLGVPVLAANGRPLASLNLATPSVRFDEEARERALKVMQAVAKDLSLQLAGWLEPQVPSLTQ